MRASGPGPGTAAEDRYDVIETIRRAFSEFLAVPTLMIAGFLLLAAGASAIDQGRISWLEPTRAVLKARVFADVTATADLLSTIAGGIITVTSITISLLLLALQQVAGSLTAEVYDQFLRRRHNQAYFGFFVGLALYALVTLATVNEGFNPVFSATLAFLLTCIALYLLIVLLYYHQPDAADGGHRRDPPPHPRGPPAAVAVHPENAILGSSRRHRTDLDHVGQKRGT